MKPLMRQHWKTNTHTCMCTRTQSSGPRRGRRERLWVCCGMPPRLGGRQQQAWSSLMEGHPAPPLIPGAWLCTQETWCALSSSYCLTNQQLIDVPQLTVCTSLEAQTVKHLPTMRETWVQSLVGKISWRRKWQPTPVFLPGKSPRWRSLVGYSPWGHKESDTTEWLHFLFTNSLCRSFYMAHGCGLHFKDVLLTF